MAMTEKTIVKVAMDGQGVLSRRGFLRSVSLGAAGLTAVSFTDMLALQADELRKRQMACILLWMGGGPSQLDTFDPKPDHANGGSIKAIDTAVPGIKIAEGWNETAKVMQDVALIRSMTNKEGNHQRATYQLHTGYTPTGTLKHPSFGCVAANELGDPKFDLPHIVSVGGQTVGAGFMGVGLEPFVVQDAQRPPANTVLPTAVGAHRFERRLGLLKTLEHSGFETRGGADRVKDHTSLYRQTASMVLSPRMHAFNLDDEPAKVRAEYGQTPFGQGCLLARRLVQAGVTFVEVRSNGWDTHTSFKAHGLPHRQAVGRPGRPVITASLIRRPQISRDARQNTRDLDGRVRPNPEDQRQRRPRPLPQGLQRRDRGRRRERRPGHRHLQPRRHRGQG